MKAAPMSTWQPICALSDIPANTGVAALVGGTQVAVIRTIDRTGSEAVYALANFDPFSKAMVLSRGIVGSKGDIPFLASPIYKQRFDLRTGACLDDATVAVPTFPVRVVEGLVAISSGWSGPCPLHPRPE